MPEELEAQLIERNFLRVENPYVPKGVLVYMRTSPDKLVTQMIWYYEDTKKLMVFPPSGLIIHMPVKFD